jgi:hypothetical protein
MDERAELQHYPVENLITRPDENYWLPNAR